MFYSNVNAALVRRAYFTAISLTLRLDVCGDLNLAHRVFRHGNGFSVVDTYNPDLHIKYSFDLSSNLLL
jgi:hypothetical protein